MYNVVGYCDAPVAPANGGINSTGSIEGDTVTYICNRGYYLSGDPIRTCQSDGEWSGAQPECIRMLNTALKCVMADMTIYSVLGNIGTFPLIGLGRTCVISFSAPL